VHSQPCPLFVPLAEGRRMERSSGHTSRSRGIPGETP
jgi:hypothetical protein